MPRPLAGRDQTCGIDVLGFVPTVGRAAFQLLDRGVQLLGWTSREVGAQVARLHDSQTSAGSHEEPCLAECFRGLGGESVRGRVPGGRRPAHHAYDVPSIRDRGGDVGAHSLLDALVVNDLGDGFLDILRRDAARFDVSGETGVEALHRRARLIAGHELVDRIKAVSARGVQPAAAQQRGNLLASHR